MNPSNVLRAKALSAKRNVPPPNKTITPRPAPVREPVREIPKQENTTDIPKESQTAWSQQNFQAFGYQTMYRQTPVYSYQPVAYPYGYVYTSPYYQFVPAVPYQSYQPMNIYPQFQNFAAKKRQMANNFHKYASSWAPEAQLVDFPTTSAALPFSAQMGDVSRGKLLDVHMSVGDLYKNIMAQLKESNQCRLSWLHRLLAKCNSQAEFDKALQVFVTFRERNLETTPETATLLIKAACRAGAPEKALKLLKDMEHTRMFPTLGGVHYLMINFSLLKKTEAVLETFDIAKERGLKPTQRTFHILIRECVDNDRIDDAMKFAEESKQADIVPNRVTYNILMNGCRKFNKPKEILQLRDQMNEHKIEINDTTVKFTALAHMMLGNADLAVKAFKEYPELDTKMEEFCEKFFEVTSEDVAQKKCVVDLFTALKTNSVQLPVTVENKLKELKTFLAKP